LKENTIENTRIFGDRGNEGLKEGELGFKRGRMRV
jgi:hypothetical protein